MNIVWPVTALFGTVFWLSFNCAFGRLPTKNRAEKVTHENKASPAKDKPFSAAVAEAASQRNMAARMARRRAFSEPRQYDPQHTEKHARDHVQETDQAGPSERGRSLASIRAESEGHGRGGRLPLSRFQTHVSGVSEVLIPVPTSLHTTDMLQYERNLL